MRQGSATGRGQETGFARRRWKGRSLAFAPYNAVQVPRFRSQPGMARTRTLLAAGKLEGIPKGRLGWRPLSRRRGTWLAIQASAVAASWRRKCLHRALGSVDPKRVSDLGKPRACRALLGSTATGIRTPVSAVRGRRPSPLDDGGPSVGHGSDRPDAPTIGAPPGPLE